MKQNFIKQATKEQQEMIFISSLLGCRNCLQSDGIRHIYSFMGANADEYKAKTEFEVMTLIENWRVDDDKSCSFCGSTNVEVHDVEVNNYPLYDFDRLAQSCDSTGEYLFMINIDKRGSNITMQPGGSPRIQKEVLEEAIYTIIDTINERPSDNYLAQIKGNFFICVSGGYNFDSEDTFIRLERFRNSGITRDEIFSSIKSLAQQLDISINAEDSEEISGANPISGKTFKGSMFTSWIYLDKEAQNLGYPFSCASFNFDDDIVIAIGTKHNESPRDFIANNQRNTFIVDDNRAPLIRDTKTIYFARKY